MVNMRGQELRHDVKIHTNTLPDGLVEMQGRSDGSDAADDCAVHQDSGCTHAT